jgi:hypothetical protein
MNTIHVVRRIFGFAGPQDLSRGLELAYVREETARAWICEQEVRERTRRDVNPFHFSQDLCDCTSMPGEILHDWLLDHDYPGYDRHGALGLEDWWEVYAEGFSAEQHERLWCIIDRVHFFEVVPVPYTRRGTSDHGRLLVGVNCEEGNRPVQAVDLIQTLGTLGQIPVASIGVNEPALVWLRVPLVPG